MKEKKACFYLLAQLHPADEIDFSTEDSRFEATVRRLKNVTERIISPALSRQFEVKTFDVITKKVKFSKELNSSRYATSDGPGWMTWYLPKNPDPISTEDLRV